MRARTNYGMATAIERAMEIDSIRLVAKRGGKSGEFVRPGEPPR